MATRKRTFITVFLIIFIYEIAISNHFDNMLATLKWGDDCAVDANCISIYLAGPIYHLHEDFVAIVREKYLVPPPAKPNKTAFDIFSAPWKDLYEDWIDSQKLLKEVFSKELPGKFIEIGAMNGEIFSKTLYLERNLSWDGLLIEPDPRSYKELVKIGRNAWLSPLCISNKRPQPMKLLTHPISNELPDYLEGLIRSRSKIHDPEYARHANYWDAQWVPCMPLSTILKAAALKEIGLLTVAGRSELEDYRTIRETLQNKLFDVKTLLFHFPRELLRTDKYPKINGYIIDVGRSLREVKFYIKKKHCLFVNETCDKTKACYHKYKCLGFLTVYTNKDH